MAGEDIIMATQEELKRLHIIHKAMDRIIIQKEGAEILGLSERQIRRIAKRIRIEGDRGIIHKSRGKDSNRAWHLSRILCKGIFPEPNIS